jgi:hypothetical protein
MPTSARRSLLAGAAIAVVLAALLLAGCGGGGGSKTTPLPALHPDRAGPQSMFTSASELTTDPSGTLSTLHKLGVDTVHVYMHWSDIAPDPTSPTRPSFDATDPAAYADTGWAPYDAIVRGAAARHMEVDLDLIPPPPRWASGKGAPDPATQPEWKPSAVEYGQFVQAVAKRYGGHFIPPGGTRPLPRVDFWSIWNEPNLGTQLAPEVKPHTQIEVAPALYRGIVDAAWKAFAATGHGHDTILIGEIAPAGVKSGVGLFNNMPALRFLRALYCVGSDYRPLRGAAASERDCPTTQAGTARFAAAHPGLFHASGLADHPYSQGLPPNAVTPGEPDFAELAAIPKLERALDGMQRLYGSSTKFPIWSTEFGYQTTPPDTESGTVSQTKAAYYMNWAEYISWEDPRIRSYDQYLLRDPPSGSFATGLLTASGKRKPGYGAFQMPLFLPVAATAHGQPLVVWGAVHPAHDAATATHRTPYVNVQFRPGTSGGFRTLQRVAITNRNGYFEIRRTFPGSGAVRLSWTPPHGKTQFSRVADITLR